jgi:hypothetical protein
MPDAGERVILLVSGLTSGEEGRELAAVVAYAGVGEVVTEDAVRLAYRELTAKPVVMDVTREVPLQYLPGSDRLSVVVGSVTDFVLETLADGRVALTGRLEMKYGQPRSAG